MRERRSQGERLENMLEKKHSGVLPYSNVTIGQCVIIFEARRKDFGRFTIGKEYTLEETNRFAIL